MIDGNKKGTHKKGYRRRHRACSLGAFIWDMLPELGSDEDAVSAVLREYDIDEDTARSDTAEFFEKLRGFGIID